MEFQLGITEASNLSKNKSNRAADAPAPTLLISSPDPEQKTLAEPHGPETDQALISGDESPAGSNGVQASTVNVEPELPDVDMSAPASEMEPRALAPSIRKAKKSGKPALRRRKSTTNGHVSDSALSSATSPFDDVLTLEKEIQDLRYQLVKKLQLQNDQLINMLKRFGS